MKYQEIAAKLRNLGCVEIARKSGGSHRKWQNPTNNKIAPMPNWGHKDLKIRTVRAIVRQRDLNWEEFKRI